MGIFDIFTGDASKNAAQQNATLYNTLQTTGNGVLDNALTKSTGALSDASAAYAPLSDLATKYGLGTSTYLDALGVNGAAGNAAANAAFTASPGYQYQLDQSLDAVNRSANARGMLASGNTSEDLLKAGSGLANQDYSSWLSNLGGLVAPELSATSGAASGTAGVDTSLAGLYSNDAASRLGLDTSVTSGLTGANNQVAQAETSGSGNLWNMGLQVAKLATGAYGSYAGGGGTTTYPGQTGTGTYGGVVFPKIG